MQVSTSKILKLLFLSLGISNRYLVFAIGGSSFNAGRLKISSNYSAVPTPSVPATPSKQNPGFVRAQSGRLYLGDKPFNFRSFNAPTLSRGSLFEDLDLLRSISGFPAPVTRCYSLGVERKYPPPPASYSDAHIVGWNQKTQNWIYNEAAFQRLDKTLAMAANEGVKIIFPIINQDYGSTGSDWVGNLNDLIRHRFQISDYAAAHINVDWYTNSTIRNDFKKIIRYLLTRKNTQNGRTYGSDDTFLAFETGNELNWAAYYPLKNNDNTNSNGLNQDNLNDNDQNKYINDISQEPLTETLGVETYRITHSRPAPAEWTLDIARYLKSLAPRILVMDGSFARTTVVTDAWPIETLQSPYVDLFSYHLYGDGDALIAPMYQAQVEKFNKAIVIGENGFFSSISSWAEFYKRFSGAGALAWSLRPHSTHSGFLTHSEGKNIYSYHIPGWADNSDEFDPMELDLVRLTYGASYSVLNQKLQPYPVPYAPELFLVPDGDYEGLSFRGSAWARSYEIWAVAEDVQDNVPAGEFYLEIDLHHPTILIKPQNATVTKKRRKAAGKWRDLKWATTTQVNYGKNDSKPLTPKNYFRNQKSSQSSHLKRALNKKDFFQKKHFEKRSSKRLEVRFIIRGISIDGVPGPFSDPFFV